jgi:hypothetical protein
LCKLVVEAQNLVNEDPRWENELALWCSEDLYTPPGKESWYGKLTYLLHHGTCPENLNPKESRALRLKSAQYHLINSILFRVNYDGVLLRCLKREDADKVLKETHDGHAGGHFAGNTTAHKILRNCKTCQMSVGKEKRVVFPLQPMVVSRPFEQWGLNIIWEITPSSSKQHRYILTATHHFTKWAYVIPLTHVNEKVVIQFIEQ